MTDSFRSSTFQLSVADHCKQTSSLTTSQNIIYVDTEMSIVANAAQFTYRKCEVTSDFARFDDKEIMENFEMPSLYNGVLRSHTVNIQWDSHNIDMNLAYEFDNESGWIVSIDLVVNEDDLYLGQDMSDEELHIYMSELESLRLLKEPVNVEFSAGFSRVIQNVIERHLESKAVLTA